MHIPDHIQELIRKYHLGQLTELEKQQLDHWYHSFNDEETIVTGPFTRSDELAERIEARLQENLFMGEEQRDGVAVIKRAKWKIPAIAIIVLLFLSAGYFYLLPGGETYQQPTIVSKALVPVNDVAPGGNRALLTLDDGTAIILDSAQNGLLGEQGNTRVKKLDNGLLAYEPNTVEEVNEEKIFYNTISTPRGGEYQVTLSDGTKVWLNAASSIRFPTVFKGTDRQVQIKGEVYFEVAKNAAKPFKVNAGRSAIEVLGTHFNVNAYDDEMQVRTSLMEGAVKVTNADNIGSQEKVLKPGQQARMNRSGSIHVVNNIDTEEIMAWKNGMFVFKSTDLSVILRQIARWYDVDITYHRNVEKQFTGQITRNSNVSKVLEILELTGEVKFKVEGKKVILLR